MQTANQIQRVNNNKMKSHESMGSPGLPPGLFDNFVAGNVGGAWQFHALLCNESLQQLIHAVHDVGVAMEFVASLLADFTDAHLFDVTGYDT